MAGGLLCLEGYLCPQLGSLQQPRGPLPDREGKACCCHGHPGQSCGAEVSRDAQTGARQEGMLWLSAMFWASVNPGTTPTALHWEVNQFRD